MPKGVKAGKLRVLDIAITPTESAMESQIAMNAVTNKFILRVIFSVLPDPLGRIAPMAKGKKEFRYLIERYTLNELNSHCPVRGLRFPRKRFVNDHFSQRAEIKLNSSSGDFLLFIS